MTDCIYFTDCQHATGRKYNRLKKTLKTLIALKILFSKININLKNDFFFQPDDKTW